MKNNIKRAVGCLVGIAMLLCCVQTFAFDGISIEWSTSEGSITLSDTPNSDVPTIKNSTHNTVKVSFAENEPVATLIIVPVVDGKPAEFTTENTVMVMQEACEENNATFSFYLMPSIENGVYAACAGGVYGDYETGYFEVNGNFAPRLSGGQQFQYDEYKKELKLKFSTPSYASFISWAEDKNDMTISMSADEKFVSVNTEDITFDVAEETMIIDTTDYSEVFPQFGEGAPGNIQQTTISIATKKYWGEDGIGTPITGTFGLIIPEISAEGFKNGLDFEITVKATEDKYGYSPIIALYDKDILVGSMVVGEIDLVKYEPKVLPVKFKCENVEESGDFLIKVFLWEGSDISPITPTVEFP